MTPFRLTSPLALLPISCWAVCLMLLQLPASASAQTTIYGGAQTTWDSDSRVITRTYSPVVKTGFNPWVSDYLSVHVLDVPPTAEACVDCPASWTEVSTLVIEVPQFAQVSVVPWILADTDLNIRIKAPAHANGPDVLVTTLMLDPADKSSRFYSWATPPDKWERAYAISAIGRGLDFDGDGAVDISIEAEDWNLDTLQLGAGADRVDLRAATHLSFPKNLKYPRYYEYAHYGGCDCGPGNDRYWGHPDIGRISSDMGPGDDRVWVISERGSSVVGGLGSDIMYGGPGQDHFYGGDMTAAGEPDGRDRLYGHGGNDKLWRYSTHSRESVYLHGGSGSDWLDAGLGNDTLVAGGGPCDRSGGDTMSGAAGRDVYIGDRCTQHVRDGWGLTVARLGAGQDDISVTGGHRHRIDCGEGNEGRPQADRAMGDWINRWVPGMRNCERIGW